MGENEATKVSDWRDNREVAGKLRAEADRLDSPSGYAGTAGGAAGRDAMQSVGNRLPARTSLLQRAMVMRRQASELEALARAIPENFPFDADSALWMLIGKAGL